MRRVLVVGLLLTGCEPTPVQGALGQVRFCLEVEGEAPPVVVEQLRRWDVSGEVVAVDSVEDIIAQVPIVCVPDKGHTVDVRDDGGRVWRVGWITTSGGEDRTPSTSLAVGDRVDVTLAHLDDFADDSVLAIRDADGLVLAGEEGYGARLDAVDPALLGGLAVERGEADEAFFYQDECGQFLPDLLEVTDDVGNQSLSSWEEATVTVDGQTLQARNVGAWSFVGEVTCTDTWGPAPWLVWR